MGNNGMASSIECKASKVTVSGQGCGTTYIPSPRCSRRRIGREEEAGTNRQNEKKKEKANQQPLANRRERYAERKEKNRDKKRRSTGSQARNILPPLSESRRSFEFHKTCNYIHFLKIINNYLKFCSHCHVTAKKLDNLSSSFSMLYNYLRIFYDRNNSK